MTKRSKSAADAAKLAEEKIRNAEMLKTIAEEANAAAEQAMQEAEEAKKAAKISTKTKASKAKASVEKASEAKKKMDDNNEWASKSDILSYLQYNKLDLMRTTEIKDLRLEEDPDRLVMVVYDENSFIPDLMAGGKKIRVETELESKDMIVITEPKEDEVFHKPLGTEAERALGISEAVGPHSKDQGKNKKAYDAWLKRHAGVKVSKV